MGDSDDERLSDAETTIYADDWDGQRPVRRSLLEEAPEEEQKTLVHQLQAVCSGVTQERLASEQPWHTDLADREVTPLQTDKLEASKVVIQCESRPSYDEELLKSIEEDARVGKDAPVVPESRPWRRAQSTLELRVEGNRARRAYGEELRRQAEADQQRRKSQIVTAKPSSLDTVAEHSQKRGVAKSRLAPLDTVSKNDRIAQMMGKRAYGEELRQQAEADKQRRQDFPLADNPCWLDPSPAGIKNPRSRRASFFDEQIMLQDKVRQSTVQIRQAEILEKHAYGKELLRQADVDRRRRRASSLCKLGHAPKALGMIDHEAFFDSSQIPDMERQPDLFSQDNRQDALQQFVDGNLDWHAKNPAVVAKPEVEFRKVTFAPKGSVAEFSSHVGIDRQARQAYGAELLQQAAEDRKRRQAKQFTQKPNQDNLPPRAFSSVAIAMGLAQ